MSRGYALVAAIFLFCAAAVWALKIDSVMVREGDLAGYRLKTKELLHDDWPVVQSIPKELRSPEAPASHARPSEYTIDEAKAGKQDGQHQVWVGKTVALANGQKWEPAVSVDYTSYDTPELAQNAIYYYIARYRFPLVGLRRTRVGPSAVVKRVPIGDVGYHIRYDQQNFLFYSKGKAVVLMDMDIHAWEDKAVQAYLKKLEKSK